MVTRTFHRLLVFLLVTALLSNSIIPAYHTPQAYARTHEDADVSPMLQTPANQPPEIVMDGDTTLTIPAEISFDVGVSDDGLPNPPAMLSKLFRTTGYGLNLRSNGNGTLSVSNPSITFRQTGQSFTLGFSRPGQLTIEVTANDGELETSKRRVITVLDGTDNTPTATSTNTPLPTSTQVPVADTPTTVPPTATPTSTPTHTPTAQPTADLPNTGGPGNQQNTQFLPNIRHGIAELTAPPNLLNPIGDRQAPLGQTLAIPLTGSSASGQRVIFDISPLPLPEHASFDVRTGMFTFRPTSDQIGTYTLNFSASDGEKTANESITITVPKSDPNAPTSLRGRIVDANDAERNIITPLSGATVRLVEGNASVTTDANGYFELTDLPEEAQYVEFDGSTANPPGTYGAYRSLQVLIPHVTNVIERPIYIMAIDAAGTTEVNPAQATELVNPSLGVAVSIPARTVMNDAGEEYSGPISISEVPDEFTPGSLPDNLDPGQVFTIQPMGLTFENPAEVTFPNTDNLPPGSEVNIWSMDHETSEFFIAGKGRVSEDGSVVTSFEGGIQESSWHFLAALGAALSDIFDNIEDLIGGVTCDVASNVTLHNGCLGTAIELPGYIAQDTAQELSLVYKSDRAYPQLLAPYAATVFRRSAVPRTIGQEINFAGKGLADEVLLSTADFSESRDETFRSVAYVDTSELDTGIYPYEIRLTNYFANSTVSTDIPRRALVVNSQDSPLGAGWSLDGLSRLYESFSGRLFMVNGDGTSALFQPQPFDLTGWTQEGNPNDGSWTVSEDRTSVFQEINVDMGSQGPTYFVSPDIYTGTTIRGTFLVEDPGDDDYIGFVIGYQSPLAANGDTPTNSEFLLFDWKKGTQTSSIGTGYEGFSLLRVNGEIENYASGFFRHEDSPSVEVVATDFGKDKGWSANVEYDFELTYDANRIRILINNFATLHKFDQKRAEVG